jgi:hypothetical protein
MRNMIGLIWCVASFIIIGLIAFGVIFIQTEWEINVSEKNIVTIYLRDEKIYEGKQAFVKILGRASSPTSQNPKYDLVDINIYKKLFPLYVLDKKYTDKNIGGIIRIEPGHHILDKR